MATVPAKGFRAENQAVGMGNVVFNQPLYDRKNLSTSLTGDVSFFTKPIGDSDTLIRYETAGTNNKTKRDTNLTANGQDPSRDYSLKGLAIVLIPTARTVAATAATNGIRRDKDNIREGGWLEFKIVENKILDIPLIMIPELNAESGVSTTSNNGTIYGGPVFGSPMWPFGTEIALNRATNFSVVCHWDGTITLSQSFDMMVVFFAKVRRPY